MTPNEQIVRVRQFEEQILPYLADLYRVALRLTGKAPDAEDLVQETCQRAFQALDQLKHPGAARVWVFAVLRSVFLRDARRRADPVRVSLDLEELEGPSLSPNEPRWDGLEHDSPLRHAALQEVRRATLQLPLPYREAIVLAHIGGFSYREMARILEVPIGTVMSRLFRARRLLRSYLRQARQSECLAEPPR